LALPASESFGIARAWQREPQTVGKGIIPDILNECREYAVPMRLRVELASKSW